MSVSNSSGDSRRCSRPASPDLLSRRAGGSSSADDNVYAIIDE